MEKPNRLKVKMKIGVMQGRLSGRILNKGYQYFPSDTWKKEFETASHLGFDYIEMVYDGSANFPKWEEIKEISEKTGVKASHMCYDKFNIKSDLIENGLYGELNPTTYTTYNTQLSTLDAFCHEDELISLLENGKFHGLEYVTLPVIEKNSIKNLGDLNRLIRFLNKINWTACKNRINITLELDLPQELLEILFVRIKNEVCPSYNIGMTLDTGNLYFDKLKICDIMNVKHVHIKDRDITGKSCVIGTGLTNFKEIFQYLRSINYHNSLTLQCSRTETFGDEFQEIVNVTNQFDILKGILNSY